MTMKLLIVDDSELIRTRLLALLESIQGIEVIRLAATLAQTLISVRREPPTLVILDLHLPDGNAIQAISPIKQLNSGIQIAMLTNDATEINLKECKKAGADWFFDKSTEFLDLLEVVRQQAARI